VLRAVAEVNLAAIERTAARARARLRPGVALCAVVKANAYGHGAVPAARAALAGGATRLAVVTAPEAAELRRGGVQAPVLILGALSDEELELAVESDAAVVVWNADLVRRAAATARARGKVVPVHVKLDSGLGRLGTRSRDEALATAELVVQAPELRLAGLMTHFATADGDEQFVAAQLAAFTPVVQAVRQLPGGSDVVVHAAASAAILRFPEAQFDMVRAGIMLYGVDPMDVGPDSWELEPALALRSYVAAVKVARPGESTGYGRHFVAEHETLIATAPIGYGDGLPRALMNNCDVLIRGHRYPLVGAVSMDNITIDVGAGSDVEVGDPVTLIGADGAERQTAEDLARRIGTIGYEVLCWISARVPRAYHRDGVPVTADREDVPVTAAR
jgi:alanine racemase